MKFIKKRPEPPALANWKAEADDDWKPTYSALRGEVKQAVVQALLAEQGAICCYCERSLAGGDLHIEHFRPQHDPQVDPLDFSNMLCSCQNQLIKGEPRHCGNLKGDWFDLELLVSPLDPACATRFIFTANGQIYPIEDNDQAAVTTINRLGLNIRKLQDLRASAIAPFLDEDLTTEEVTAFVAGYLAPSETGNFSPFWTTIQYLFQ